MFEASMSHSLVPWQTNTIAYNISISYQSIAVIQSVDSAYKFLSRLIQNETIPFLEQHHEV